MNLSNPQTVIDLEPIPTITPNFSPEPIVEPYPPEFEPGPVIPTLQDIPKVKIKSLFSNAFIILGYGNVLYAVGTIAQQGETFKIIPINNYQVKLRVVGGQFVRIDVNGVLVADTSKNNATIFNIFRTGYMEFSLMAPTGRYVDVRQRDYMLIARSEYANSRTRFRFRRVD